MSKIDELQDLKIFFLQLEEILLAPKIFELFKKKSFYLRHINAIKLIPYFSKFGFSQYYLYLDPINLTGINLKLLLGSTFQSIKHLKMNGEYEPLLIKYIYPHNDPNVAYLNWLAKSKRAIREYFLFNITKFHIFLNIEAFTITSEKENSVENFKRQTEIILATPLYRSRAIIKSFDCNKSLYFYNTGPNSDLFKSFLEFYGKKSPDIKTILTTSDLDKIDRLKHLLSRELIHPYISYKELKNHITLKIILFHEKLTTLYLIQNIFTFFPYGHICQIKGTFFDGTISKTSKCNNGLMIKFQLPKDKLKAYIESFELLFNQLHIELFKIIIKFYIKSYDERFLN